MSRIKVLQQLTGTPLLATARAAASGGTLSLGFRATAIWEFNRGPYLMIYTEMKRGLGGDLDGQNLALWGRVLAGAGANVVIWMFWYLVETIRNVQQSALATRTAEAGHLGLIESGRSLVATGGIKRLYRGYLPAVLRAGPVAGVVLPLFELSLGWLETY